MDMTELQVFAYTFKTKRKQTENATPSTVSVSLNVIHQDSIVLHTI